jgi:hypothetical protein
MDRAERFSNNILSQHAKWHSRGQRRARGAADQPAAMDMLHIQREADVLGEPLVRIMDPFRFRACSRTGAP